MPDSILAGLKGFQLTVVAKNLELLDLVFRNGSSFSERKVTVSPTGSGKTRMMSAIIQKSLQTYPNACFVWITHNKQITNQTAQNFHESLAPNVCTASSIEAGVKSNARVLLLNVQKGLSKKAQPWLSDWIQRQNERGRICVFVVDEADEGQSGLNMQSLRDILNPRLELGFTASFKQKTNEVLFFRVPYADVVDAQMIVDNIYYEVSPEVALRDMLKHAIERRNRLESLTNILRGTERFFVPKMAIQTNASKAEEMRSLLSELLNLSPKEVAKQIVIHTQDHRGLDGQYDIDELRYVIGDLMIERGWDFPQLYVLAVAKDSLSETKGVQLLGRVLRLPDATRFEDEELQPLNAGYVYIAGKHSIQKSCEYFMAQGLMPSSGDPFGVRTETITRRPQVELPVINTTTGELVEEIWSEDLDAVVDGAVGVIFSEVGRAQVDQPNLRTGRLELNAMTHSPLSIKKIEADWNYEHTKGVLRNSLIPHFHQGFCDRIVGEFHEEIIVRGQNITEISAKIREAAGRIKRSQYLRRLSLSVELKRAPFLWPDTVNVKTDPLPLSFSRSLFPKISGLNKDEADFATVLNESCERQGWFWFRNTPSDIMLTKSGYPDFVVFTSNSYVFIEYKGPHLANTEDSVLKNFFGQSRGPYYMVVRQEDGNFYSIGPNGAYDLFDTVRDLGIYLRN